MHDNTSLHRIIELGNVLEEDWTTNAENLIKRLTI